MLSCTWNYRWPPFIALHHLIFMPLFQVLCILHNNLLIGCPHVLHDLRQVLTFGSVNVHLHAWLGDLSPQLYHLLQRWRKERHIMPIRTHKIVTLLTETEYINKVWWLIWLHSKLTLSWFFLRKTSSSLTASISLSMFILLILVSSMTLFSPAMSASTDWRIAISFSNLQNDTADVQLK